MIVIACGTASAAAYETLSKKYETRGTETYGLTGDLVLFNSDVNTFISLGFKILSLPLLSKFLTSLPITLPLIKSSASVFNF